MIIDKLISSNHRGERVEDSSTLQAEPSSLQFRQTDGNNENANEDYFSFRRTDSAASR